MAERDGLDRAIEAALATETRHVPSPGFHGRVQLRLRLAALAERERRLFSRPLTAMAGAFATGCAGVSLALLDPAARSWLLDQAPGAVGQLDGALSLYLGGGTLDVLSSGPLGLTMLAALVLPVALTLALAWKTPSPRAKAGTRPR